jgi:hypothetical protein
MEIKNASFYKVTIKVKVKDATVAIPQIEFLVLIFTCAQIMNKQPLRQTNNSSVLTSKHR